MCIEILMNRLIPAPIVQERVCFRTLSPTSDTQYFTYVMLMNALSEFCVQIFDLTLDDYSSIIFIIT